MKPAGSGIGEFSCAYHKTALNLVRVFSISTICFIFSFFSLQKQTGIDVMDDNYALSLAIFHLREKKPPNIFKTVAFVYQKIHYFRHKIHLQYPVLQIPHPFRDKIRARITRYYGAYQSCMPFYKDFFKCAYEVGQPVEHQECWREYQDMRECETSWKTVRHFHLCIIYIHMP